MSGYQKCGKNHPSYTRIQACKQAGLWICDAWTHNSLYGCTNPECFKYKPRKKK